MSEHCAGCGYLHVYHGAPDLRCPDTKTKTFQVRPPLDRSTWREIMRRDFLVRQAVYDEARKPYAPPVATPPLVPARYTQALDEIAPRAMPLGMQAAALGWTVDPWYWQWADGTEVSALVMQRDELRALARWHGRPWKSDGAYAWRAGEFPQAVGVVRLTQLIKELGRADESHD